MKWLILVFIGGLITYDSNFQVTPSYNPRDLKKLKWIEGGWKGMDGDKPFYEIYRFLNDSTIETISYQWNGTDSSKTEKGYLFWKKNAFYLGEQLNWKVVSISDSQVYMKPNFKAYNDILWKRVGRKEWVAVLNSDRGTKEYRMTAFYPFKKK